MKPPTMLKNATVDHASPAAPAARIRSHAREKIQRPIGKTISIGWIGCLKMLAGVRMGGVLARLPTLRAQAGRRKRQTSTDRVRCSRRQLRQQGSRSSQAASDCELYEAREAIDIELLHKAAAIGVDRLGRKKQRTGDVGRAFAGGDPLQDLAFATAQLPER